MSIPELTAETMWYLATQWAYDKASRHLDQGHITEREAGERFALDLLTTYTKSCTMRGITPTFGHKLELAA